MLDSFIIWFRDYISVFEFIFLFIYGIMLGVTMYLNAKLGLTKEKIDHMIDVVGSKNISRRNQLNIWKRIKRRLASGTPSDLRLAVVDADRVLDEILKVSHFPGTTMDERLASITEAQLPNIKEVLEVHRLRHRIGKDPGIILTQEEAENAVNIYKKVFVDFGLLDPDA